MAIQKSLRPKRTTYLLKGTGSPVYFEGLLNEIRTLYTRPNDFLISGAVAKEINDYTVSACFFENSY
jgi:hypothetical protein